jgi:diguanylate cyclase (GGDEF)-like protein
MGRKGNILLVDDQPQNLDLLSSLLEAQGYEVRQAIDPAMVFPAIDLALPDLILLDIQMPRMDGYEICERLKADPDTEDIPVIFISALDEAWDKVKAFGVGGADYITKPFKTVEVLARVKNQFKIRRLQQELRQQNAKLEAVVAQLQAANQELKRLSTLDGLTQIANRRYFDEYLHQSWGLAMQEEQPITLIMCDIDYFKKYNDTYGHQAGDRCLYKVAQILARSVNRAEDMTCRYGGEEFAIILPRTDQAGGQQVAQRIAQTLQTQRLIHAGSPVSPYVTVSMGIVSLVPSLGTKPELLIRLADLALYRAKAQGRNTIVTFDS